MTSSTSKYKYNFNAGPAALPDVVLQEATAALADYAGTGLSILEIAHRGSHFDAILEEANALVKELCGLDDSYEVLWLQGGGRMQFCMLPMNFLPQDGTAGYIDSGHWAADAAMHAAYYGKVNILASSKDQQYKRLPEWPQALPKGLSYLHLTTNNTIYGTQWEDIPACEVPLIADMSSDILSMPRNYSQFDMFYAVAQKNLGAAGVTMVAIRKELLSKPVRELPPMLNYAAHAKHNSVLNTPPVFAIYTCLLMLRWIKATGLAHIISTNRQKAELLYAEVNRNSLFQPRVSEAADRSAMNVCFDAVSPELEKAFAAFADAQGFYGIKGHRTAGGFRASLYNAVIVENVQALIATMQAFEQQMD